MFIPPSDEDGCCKEKNMLKQHITREIEDKTRLIQMKMVAVNKNIKLLAPIAGGRSREM